MHLGKKQFSNSIIINASTNSVWDVLTDSMQMESWGPPVTKVEVLSGKSEKETVGSVRKVFVQFGRRKGYFKEKRINQIELKRLDYQIFEENIGLFKVLKDVGFSIEIEPAGNEGTELTFSFYQNPKGILGRLMHPIIKMNQRKGNKEGLVSLKNYIEHL